jgi:hypothetical protein
VHPAALAWSPGRDQSAHNAHAAITDRADIDPAGHRATGRPETPRQRHSVGPNVPGPVARLIDELHGPKKLAARLVRFDGAYLRLTGELRIEHRHADAVVDSYTSPAIWELMYLGKTGTRQ